MRVVVPCVMKLQLQSLQTTTSHFQLADLQPVDVQGLYQQAYSLRERLLCANLVSAGLGRRYTEDMKFNEYGQVYF